MNILLIENVVRIRDSSAVSDDGNLLNQGAFGVESIEPFCAVETFS